MKWLIKVVYSGTPLKKICQAEVKGLDLDVVEY